MMTPDIKILYNLGVVPPKATPLYADALLNSSLHLSDYQTIRDLLSTVEEPDLALNALLILMFNNLAHGSLCLSLKLDNVNSKIAEITKTITFDETQIKACLKVLHKSGLLADAVTPGTPFTVQNNYLYFQRFYNAEKQVQDSLTRLMSQNEDTHVGSHDLSDIEFVLTDVCQSMQTFKLNPLQLLAVCCGLTKNFIVISGGPGTGKTSTATALLRSMVRLGVNPTKIKLTAPTGRAAQRLGESLKQQMEGIDLSDADRLLLNTVEGQTIHRLLKYNPHTGGFAYGPDNPIDADVILIDEVSMVDVFMMGNVLSALKPDCRVIFLGDKDQLPSVDEGAVLESLIPSGYVHGFSKDVVALCKNVGTKALSLQNQKTTKDSRQDRIIILEQSHRSVKGILNFAKSVNQGVVGEFNEVIQHQSLIQNYKPWQQFLENWIAENYTSYKIHVSDIENCNEQNLNHTLQKIFSINESSQILAMTRGGLQGKSWINQTINGYMRSNLDESGSENIFAGASIIVTSNSYINNLFNGDTGVILKRKGEYRAWFRMGVGFRNFSLKFLATWEAAFAITVHKSQGSEYGRVLIVFPEDNKNKLLSKQIVYTGITRAKISVLVAGSKDSIDIAVSSSVLRESGLGIW